MKKTALALALFTLPATRTHMSMSVKCLWPK